VRLRSAPCFAILVALVGVMTPGSASGRAAADDVSVVVQLGVRAPGGVSPTIETRTNGLDFIIVVTVNSQTGVLQPVTVTIGLPEGLRWGADAPDPSEGCAGTAPAVCTQRLEINPAGTAGAGWFWNVVAERTGFYEIGATVQPTDVDPDVANNQTTFRFEVAPSTSSGAGVGGSAVSTSAVSFVPARPQAGQVLVARVRVSAAGRPLRPARVACTGAVGAVRVAGRPRAALGVASCSFRPQTSARAKTLRGSVAFTARGQRFTKRFSAKLR
jgi:hypothetical protein